jgi:colanic acid biosynthesis glycosyl transferase WcaI
MRILFVSQYFMPESGATSELLSGIATKLVENDFNVGALAAQPSYFGAGKIEKVFELDGAVTRRVWSTQLSKNTTLGRVLNSTTFATSILVALLFGDRKQLAIAVTNPPLLLWVCYAAHKLVGLRYVLLINDVYPDIAVSLGLLKERGRVARAWRHFNRLSYGAAERIVVLGRDMEEVIGRNVDNQVRERIRIIPNWADGGKIVPIPRDQHPLLDELGVRSRFVVQYSGNIGRFHEIETILDAAARLDGEAEFLFLFYGDGKQVDLVRRAADSSKNGTVRLLPFQPRDRLGLTLTGCDVGLVTLKQGLTGLAVPSKLYGILAAGKPVVVIGPYDCEAARLVRDEKCGEVVRPGDGVSLAQTLRRLRDDPGSRATYGLRARHAFECGYDLPAVAADWARLLRELCISS